MQKAGWFKQWVNSDKVLYGRPFWSGLGEQAQENHSAASNHPAWGLKETADLSVSQAPLC